MQAIALSQRPAVQTGCTPLEALPDPVPRPPGRPPGEPIIIKDPSRPSEVPEMDGSLDEEEEPEIKQPPPIVPEKPPPPAPWERAQRAADRALARPR